MKSGVIENCVVKTIVSMGKGVRLGDQSVSNLQYQSYFSRKILKNKGVLFNN